ncbi:phage shock protein PspC (stress-responsive transcriptional regulator) [Aeromicrobium panaciterrae]|uniref:Phage shock protein PspC (Stress-responsive transcriptional regulator) n=1 Tax=Aeromicrobium panaciterrae TaxID=363861 RepID=A0ABU1UR98_9ACTN|nr:PspC domain-containing protein [Aeromicrobium panaciterrae]MDR7087692.1 phage shock protein PspC (stress-responsive transcriptional regulator) [Aeromicrobium panaciterrae]
MNDTQEAPRATGPDDEFDPHKLRTIADVKRSTEDRWVAGVCSGVAKYLNIDPVIVRIVIAVLTIVGAGAILYGAAWLLLPSDDADKSIAAGWFKLDDNEEQVRKIGLVAAGVIAAFSVLGSHGDWWWGTGWLLVPLAALYYFFVVRPRKGDREAIKAQVMAEMPTTEKITAEVQAKIDKKVAEKIAHARQRKSKALPLLTLSLIAIGVASTRIYADTHDVNWTTYVAVALAITGIGLVIGTFWGYGGPLIFLGIVLGLVLAIGSALPHGRVGEQRPDPTTADGVQARYEHGIGLLELDLTGVSDPTELLGRTIALDAGIGETRVIVPDGLNVEVDAEMDLGEISVFGRKDHGQDAQVNTAATGKGEALTIKIDQRVGNVEVVRS